MVNGHLRYTQIFGLTAMKKQDDTCRRSPKWPELTPGDSKQFISKSFRVENHQCQYRSVKVVNWKQFKCFSLQIYFHQSLNCTLNLTHFTKRTSRLGHPKSISQRLRDAFWITKPSADYLITIRRALWESRSPNCNYVWRIITIGSNWEAGIGII